MANTDKGKAWKLPSSQPILIYFELRSKPSLITVICMDPHSPNKLFATKYCFLILGDEFLFLNHFFISLFCFLLFYVILLLIIFTKTMLLLSFYLINFFSWKLLLFFHVPGCSGIFRHVPECYGMFHVPDFIDAPVFRYFIFLDTSFRSQLPYEGTTFIPNLSS